MTEVAFLCLDGTQILERVPSPPPPYWKIAVAKELRIRVFERIEIRTPIGNRWFVFVEVDQ